MFAFFLTLRTWPFRFYVEFLVQISAGLCISYSSYCNDHILEECNLEKKMVFYLTVQYGMKRLASGVWGSEGVLGEAAESKGCLLSASILLFMQLRTPIQEMVPPTFRNVFP